jgi:hypothetical protein
MPRPSARCGRRWRSTSHRALLDFVAPLRSAPDVLHRPELVLEEALINRLWHAWPDGGEHRTALAVEVLPDALRLMF